MQQLLHDIILQWIGRFVVKVNLPLILFLVFFFGRSAEFAQKYFRKGMRIAISGRIQTGSYINKDGVKIHTTEIVIEEQEFAQSKAENHINSTSPENFSGSTDNIDEDLPFN